ncbi:hypothetical protein [Celeribacter persicus]|uniref:Uncharacterized protein n=1 Tax=Celeribacter persicus TaxID=1651082 RepID=A0A2T5HME5_9RHOB|nr:hypothetical protein [Celeribacter persicus]PTQ72729.1 hypothetical protein C8N42_106241 [Celeribacter persicus]
MASVSELVDGLSKALGEPRDKANKYARALIDADLLPKSSGRAVAQVEIVHFVRLLTAMALQPKIKDTGERVAEYLNLPMAATSHKTGERINRDMTCEDMLVKVFCAALTRSPGELTQASIHFVVNFPLVEVTMPSPKVLELIAPEMVVRFKPHGVPLDLDDLPIRRSVIVWADSVKSMGFDLEGCD